MHRRWAKAESFVLLQGNYIFLQGLSPSWKFAHSSLSAAKDLVWLVKSEGQTAVSDSVQSHIYHLC